MVSPNRDMAIVSAWALVSAFVGRKDSFLRNPPTMILTLLAINGVGKDTLKKLMERIVNDLAMADPETGEGAQYNAYSFMSVEPSFGVSEMVKDELKILSGVRITSEAGLNGQSKAGDSATVRASLLQNTAADAYSRRSYKKIVGTKDMPHGVNVSVYDESTPETYLQSMGGTLATGEAARRLMVRIDASKVGRTKFLDKASRVPSDIRNIFQVLYQEAIRGENFDCEAGVSANPVDLINRRYFEPEPDAVKFIEELEDADTQMRKANTENDPTLDWAQSVRTPQLIFRMALIAARTRHLMTYTGLATVGAEDLQAAKAFVDECRRTERANCGDYDDTYTRAAEKIKTWAAGVFKRGNLTAAFRKGGKTGDLELKRVRMSIINESGNKGILDPLRAIAEEKGTSSSKAFEEVAVHGDHLGWWVYDNIDKSFTLK